jgi:alpha-L-rhamnosidase
MRAVLTLAASVLLPLSAIHASEVESLRCEFRTNPLAIDAAKPGLSWKLETGNLKPERGIKQTAYQILVASSADLLKKDTGDLWDSGKVVSDQSVHIDYQGKPLASGGLCHWKVRVWEEKFEGGNRKPETGKRGSHCMEQAGVLAYGDPQAGRSCGTVGLGWKVDRVSG